MVSANIQTKYQHCRFCAECTRFEKKIPRGRKQMMKDCRVCAHCFRKHRTSSGSKLPTLHNDTSTRNSRAALSRSSVQLNVLHVRSRQNARDSLSEPLALSEPSSGPLSVRIDVDNANDLDLAIKSGSNMIICGKLEIPNPEQEVDRAAMNLVGADAKVCGSSLFWTRIGDATAKENVFALRSNVSILPTLELGEDRFGFEIARLSENRPLLFLLPTLTARDTWIRVLHAIVERLQSSSSNVDRPMRRLAKSSLAGPGRAPANSFSGKPSSSANSSWIEPGGFSATVGNAKSSSGLERSGGWQGEERRRTQRSATSSHLTAQSLYTPRFKADLSGSKRILAPSSSLSDADAVASSAKKCAVRVAYSLDVTNKLAKTTYQIWRHADDFVRLRSDLLAYEASTTLGHVATNLGEPLEAEAPEPPFPLLMPGSLEQPDNDLTSIRTRFELESWLAWVLTQNIYNGVPKTREARIAELRGEEVPRPRSSLERFLCNEHADADADVGIDRNWVRDSLMSLSSSYGHAGDVTIDDGKLTIEELVARLDAAAETGQVSGDGVVGMNGFDSEYARVDSESRINGREMTFDTATMRENMLKNRYNNVLAADNTRVHLETLLDERYRQNDIQAPSAMPFGPACHDLVTTGDELSDYVNANWVDGLPSTTLHSSMSTGLTNARARAYIATQGPLENTVAHFWRMCWQTNARVIVMVTREVERFRQKCVRYWPDDARTPINVRLCGCDIDDHDLRPEFLTNPQNQHPLSVGGLHGTGGLHLLSGSEESDWSDDDHYDDIPDASAESDDSEDEGEPRARLQISLLDEIDEVQGKLIRREFEMKLWPTRHLYDPSTGLHAPVLERPCTPEVRRITQYQYEEWPDHGTPDTSDVFLHLIEEVDKTNVRLSDGCFAPLVVHCSAGIGRTGTFCAVHASLARFLEDNERGDTGRHNWIIADSVVDFRKQRAGMVQTRDQFEFIFRATLDQVCKLRNSRVPLKQP